MRLPESAFKGTLSILQSALLSFIYKHFSESPIDLHYFHFSNRLIRYIVVVLSAKKTLIFINAAFQLNKVIF